MRWCTKNDKNQVCKYAKRKIKSREDATHWSVTRTLQSIPLPFFACWESVKSYKSCDSEKVRYKEDGCLPWQEWSEWVSWVVAGVDHWSTTRSWPPPLVHRRPLKLLRRCKSTPVLGCAPFEKQVADQQWPIFTNSDQQWPTLTNTDHQWFFDG